MKNLSRLTALLLALVMLLGITASATELSNYTKSDYDQDIQALIDDFPNLPVEQQYSLIVSMEDPVQAEALLAMLSEEQLAELTAYAAAQIEVTVGETVVFTDVGPFMPPVEVAPARSMMRLMTMAVDETDDGVYTSKTVEATDDGYKITLETYVTGETTEVTEEKYIPVDFVLVLDRSSSMSNSFGSTTRMAAMKTAVSDFITTVNENYKAGSSDHRIALVTFDASAAVLAEGWVEADDNGATRLKRAVNGISVASVADTNVAAGMQSASSLLNDNYDYAGSNTSRQQVVIVFTDGIPITSSSERFDTGIADAALSSAAALKGKGVTIYTVGVFSGANIAELYGSVWRSAIGSRNCNGKEGSAWGYSGFLGWISSFVGNDFDDLDVPAGNRFLNYLSSNFTRASAIGIEYDGNYRHPGVLNLGGGPSYILTEDTLARDHANYYLAAADTSDLSSIFTKITQNIQSGSANAQLGATTVVMDVISDYFKLDGTVADVKVYTADLQKNGSFAKPEQKTDFTVVYENNTVSVSGFDFARNYCNSSVGRVEGNSSVSGSFYGRKLIVEIPIKVKPGFLGGNDVPTNDDNSSVLQDSGVYSADGKVAEYFTAIPSTVDVPVVQPEVTAEDKNVYLFESTLTDEDIATVTVMDTYGKLVQKFDLAKADENYGLEAWQTAFVYPVIHKTPLPAQFTQDFEYGITCEMKNVGEEVLTPIEYDETAKVNVFLPVLTFQDSAINYLAIVDDVDQYHVESNYVSTAWKHAVTVDGVMTETDSTTVTMTTDNPPDLTLTYTPDATWITDGKVTSIVDVPVNVSVKIDNNDISGYTTTVRNACDVTACANTEVASGSASEHNPEFVVHVQNVYGKLVIEKVGLKTGESAIFTVSGCIPNGTAAGEHKTWTIVLTGIDENGTSVSKTLTGLLVGSAFNASEESGWTWGYTCTGPEKTSEKINPLTETTAKVTFTNTKTEQWLYDESAAVNPFTGSTN